MCRIQPLLSYQQQIDLHLLTQLADQVLDLPIKPYDVFQFSAQTETLIVFLCGSNRREYSKRFTSAAGASNLREALRSCTVRVQVL